MTTFTNTNEQINSFTGLKGNPELTYKDKKGNIVKVSAYDAAHYPESHPAYQAYMVRFADEKFGG
jgi:hypothetical protein